MTPWSIGQPFSHVDAYAGSNYIGDNEPLEAMRQNNALYGARCCSRTVRGAVLLKNGGGRARRRVEPVFSRVPGAREC